MANRARDLPSKKDFELFQKEFKKWQYKFGLTGYKVYFKYEPTDDDCYADITTEQNSMVATVRLNSSIPVKQDPFRDIKRSAKHEAIHLLLHRLENIARSRYCQPEEVYESCEELCFKLEDLIG